MTQIIPKTHQPGFRNDCAKTIDKCVIDNLSDVVIMGGLAINAIFDIDVDKFGFDDGPQSSVRTITLYWLKESYPNASQGTVVKYNGRQYKMKSGYPMDQQDCWMMAELTDCGSC